MYTNKMNVLYAHTKVLFLAVRRKTANLN